VGQLFYLGGVEGDEMSSGRGSIGHIDLLLAKWLEPGGGTEIQEFATIWKKNKQNMESTFKEIPNQVREAVLQVDKDAEIILFGSRARGDYASESDWDFLILLNNPVTLEAEELIRNKIYDIELETDEVITSIIEQKSEWEKYEEALIYKNIEKQGKLVA
jgi:uncharacterized protein